MPTYPHICHACEFEWEEFYSIRDEPPTKCPKCETEGQVERLIGGCCGRGIVQLTGHELNEKIKEDSAKFEREVQSNEKLLANLVGEQKYHSNELYRDQVTREFGGSFRRSK